MPTFATRGCAEVSGDCNGDTGELGEHDSSDEEDSETECERPLRTLIGMGMGLECSFRLSETEDMVSTRGRKVLQEGGAAG